MTSMDNQAAAADLDLGDYDEGTTGEALSPIMPLPQAGQANLDLALSHDVGAIVRPVRGIFDRPEERGSERYAMLPAYRSGKLFRRLELPALLAGSLLPAIAAWGLLDRALFSGAFLETLLALTIAIIAAWYVLLQLRSHANARDVSYVLPVNFTVFTGVVTSLALARIPYSGSLLAVGAVFAVGWSFALAIYGRRLVQPHVIVAGGRASEIAIGGQYVPAPSVAKLEHLIESGWRDWVIVADLHYPHSERHERLFAKAALAGIPVYHFRAIAEDLSGQVKINHLSENDFGSLIPNAPYMVLKRLVDVLGALVLIPLCALPFAVLAVLIRLESPGKPFFIQERVGYRGRTFRMVKFRTMRERTVASSAAEQRADAMTKNDDDRITAIGYFLRKTRLDELPQFINVLRGEMSFIGPRPEACALSAWYQSELPFYSYRHIVRPGITGWAQVTQGHVTDVSEVRSKLRYDFYYIKNVSLWLDALIVLKTVWVILTGSGAK